MSLGYFEKLYWDMHAICHFQQEVPFLGFHKLHENMILSLKDPVFHISGKLVNVSKGG